MMIINFISAPCGSGKTGNALQYIALQARHDKRYILIQPTIELIDETMSRLDAAGYKGAVRKITSKTYPGRVSAAIHEFLNNPHEFRCGGVLLLTFEAWQRIKRHNMKDWHLIVDECPKVFNKTSFRSKTLLCRLMECIKIGAGDASGYASVRIDDGNRSALEKLYEDSHNDDSLSPIKDTIDYLLRNWQTFVRLKTLQKAIDSGVEVQFYHICKPQVFGGFKSCTMMGANFEESLVFHVWKFFGVEFKQKMGFGGEAMAAAHSETIGVALDIYYLDEDWSKYKKKKNSPIYETEIKRAVDEIIGDEPFIWSVNSTDNPRLFEGRQNAVYVRPNPQGLNSYRNYNNVVIYAHFNYSLDQVDFLRRHCKIADDIAWDILNKDYYYQIVTRSSLREAPSALIGVEPMKIVLMDGDMARYLQALFPGSRVHKFESEAIAEIQVKQRGRKPVGKTAMSNAQRVQKCRSAKKIVDLDRKLSLCIGNINESCNENTLIDNRTCQSSIEPWPYTIIGSKYDSWTTEPIDGFDEFVQRLKEASHRQVRNKTENQMVNLTRFKLREDGERRRQKPDVDVSYGIWLDVDEGNTCPIEFAGMYSGLELLVYSSFSSTPDNKRWRVVIPLSQPVTVEQYETIARELKEIVSIYGYTTDKSKINATDFFNLPCNRDVAVGFVFEHFKGGGRRPLDVDFWFHKPPSRSSCGIGTATGVEHRP